MKIKDLKKYVRLINGQIMESDGQAFKKKEGGRGRMFLKKEGGGGVWLQVMATADNVNELELSEFDYEDLKKFIEVPRSTNEIRNRFKFHGAKLGANLFNIMTNATFLMPVYEFRNEHGEICYGLMQKE